MRKSSILDHGKDEVPFDGREARRAATRATGKSALAQRLEILRLRRSIGRLTAQEYYAFRLYDDSRFTRADKERFLGMAAQNRMLPRCTDRRWWALAHDKIVFHSLMSGHGFPVPRITATYHRFRSVPAAAALHTADDVGAYLRTRCEYPFFSKPFHGMFSVGTVRVDAYDPAADELVIHTGERVPVDEFVRSLDRYARHGYLFQDVKHPHECMREICGDRIATVRIIVMVGAEGPTVFRTLWKIPTGGHVADNFWRRGNMLAAVDSDTGEVVRVVTGVGHQQVEVERHPDTGRAMAGFKIPHWQQAKEICLAAAGTMPGLDMQAWDIAICREGPVLIEANIGGDFNLPQIASGVGLLDDRFRKLLSDSNYKHR
jgi:hypothetical protein